MRQGKSKKESNLSEQEILQKLLSDKVKSIDPNYVFQGIVGQDGHITYKLANKKLGSALLGQLRNEAQMLQKMQLWKIFTETLRNQAHLKLFEKMNSLDDSHYGKALLQCITVFETIAANIQTIQPETPPPHTYAPKSRLSTEDIR